MMPILKFRHLNPDWNAEPNAPEPNITHDGPILHLKFFLNPFAYVADHDEVGRLSFENCAYWRLGETNDEGWFRGNCRFSQKAPEWGEFFEVIGDDPLNSKELKWQKTGILLDTHKHYLFYFRDETFECFATDWNLTRNLRKLKPNVGL